MSQTCQNLDLFFIIYFLCVFPSIATIGAPYHYY